MNLSQEPITGTLLPLCVISHLTSSYSPVAQQKTAMNVAVHRVHQKLLFNPGAPSSTSAGRADMHGKTNAF